MSVRTKKLLSVLSFLFSLVAVGMGDGPVGATDYPFAVRFLFTLV